MGNVDYFEDSKQRDRFIKKFREMVTIYCKNVQDVRAMLHTLEMLQFNDRFCQILREIPELNGELMNAIQMTDNQQILVIFSSYGYPFLNGLNMAHQHQYQQEQEAEESRQQIEQLKATNEQLQSENMRLKAEME